MLLKSKIPTPNQMVQIDKEAERQKSKLEKRKSTMEQRNPIRIEDCEESLSSSLMSMHGLDSDEEDSDVPSNQSPTIVIHKIHMFHPNDLPLLLYMMLHFQCI